jgi:hypothetical protein
MLGRVARWLRVAEAVLAMHPLREGVLEWNALAKD